jgi:hypothetical protein
MTRTARSHQRGAHPIIVAIVLVGASRAFADPIKCERQIAQASAKFAQTKAKLLQGCENKKAAGRFVATTNCHAEPKTASGIQTATGKLAQSVAKDCGGADKTCGTSDDEPLLGIGWGAIGVCPNFENGACNAPITDCNGIVTCLTCVDEAAVDQAIALYYGSLSADEFGTRSAVSKCQRAIGKETTKFLEAKSKALQKCWDARLKGKHGNPCPTPGDGKAQQAIAAAEAQKVANICKACGGADRACGGSDDLSPSDIGFPTTCPGVTIPGAPSSCSGAILDVQDIVDCVDCVTEFKVDCVDRLAVPEFVPYPPECNGTTSTTTTSSSTTTTSAPGQCGNGMVDPGEPCDPSSPGGAFTCAPGEVCSGACTCEPTSTTTTSTMATTTTTSPATTTTTVAGTCGNGVVDPGEPCDASSPTGAFTCAPGEVCSVVCTCESTTTSTTTASTTSTSSTTTTSTTTTTVTGSCGNGMVDAGEPCDPSSPGGAFTCAPGEVCSAGCTCEPTTSTSTVVSTTTPPTTSTSSTEAPTTTAEPPSTSTSSTSSTTTSTTLYGSPSRAFFVRPPGLLD